ncbi:hypothetical protein VF21_03883 [Pseudogymnoascus sp. 05NY08]|nr:hypothetical protein VF21_03883 [Pseudogymnoascus sp. 05NY08]
MASSRSEHPSLGYLPPSMMLQPRSGSSTGNTSPIELPNSSARSPFGNPPGLTSVGKMAGNSRSGAGSPSHELGSASRLFSKRAREIQAQEGVPVNVWGPPTSGNSTPLRENIPESPTDGFPDYIQLPTPESLPQGRRARAGTVPSRFAPGAPLGGLGGLSSLGSKTSRPSPSPSPYMSPSPGLGEIGDHSSASNNAALLSRLRAGSVPQHISNFSSTTQSGSGPFGPSVFSTNWTSGRERTSTLASIASLGSNGPNSPTQSSFSKEGTGENDMQMRTLDYLGLADTPQPPRATLAANPFLANMIDANRQASRFRSYSVNATEKYADEEEDDYGTGSMTPYEAHQARLQYEVAQTHAAIQQHNLAVQAFANQASTNRPRARTAGVLESPGPRGLLRNYYPSSRLENSISVADLRDSAEYDGLPEAVQALNLGYTNGQTSSTHLTADEANLEGPTRALWLGSIPSSTTTSTLTEMFKSHGAIISARVLTHKNCGFVNFERLESAISAKAMMNGKEIFPGAGPVRINFAKPPSSNGTPGHDGAFPSPSPDPFSQGQENGNRSRNGTPANAGAISRPSTTPPTVPRLQDMRSEILSIVKDFSATDEERQKIDVILQQALQYDGYDNDIPPVAEPSLNRIHDAPKLRDIRKRIDNNSWSQSEIENIAMEMLPEVAELSSDYLGNTVVQKLFEFCSDPVRDAMLAEIVPHMAEIGVHKNGTWAAQKIIDVCRLPTQMSSIVEAVRPYTVPLFLDQFGNYVLQCCLRFGSPYNDFIFEIMLTKMWEIAQGRYGSRAMRACLESHHATREQQRILAAAIALNSVQLAANANGALLLTWLLDTCTFPQRRTVLAPRLVPHLVHLCTHKVAYLTVLKVINQRNEPEARDIILQALFFSPDNKVLEDILTDHICGPTLIFKVLTTPFFDENIRAQVVENIRSVLVKLKAQPGQGYKRLMDEVGLPTRNGSAGPREHTHSQERAQRSVTQTNAQTNGGGGGGQQGLHQVELRQQQQQQHSPQPQHHHIHQQHHQQQQQNLPQQTLPPQQQQQQYSQYYAQQPTLPLPLSHPGYDMQRTPSLEPLPYPAPYGLQPSFGVPMGAQGGYNQLLVRGAPVGGFAGYGGYPTAAAGSPGMGQLGQLGGLGGMQGDLGQLGGGLGQGIGQGMGQFGGVYGYAGQQQPVGGLGGQGGYGGGGQEQGRRGRQR